MIKIVLKEFSIILLICIAILLLLGIILYDYNPLNKVIPNRIAYTTPEDIKKEIDEQSVKDVMNDRYNVVYSIENADLQKYKKSKRYIPGKAHPFGETSPSIGEEYDNTLAIPELLGDGGVTSSSSSQQTTSIVNGQAQTTQVTTNANTTKSK